MYPDPDSFGSLDPDSFGSVDPDSFGSVDPDPEVYDEGKFSTETAEKRPEEQT